AMPWLADKSERLELVGLTEQLRVRAEADRRRAAGAAALAALADGPSADSAAPGVAAATQSEEEASAMREKIGALGDELRAGLDPEDAARVLGLEGVTFTGAAPVSLRLPESQAEDLEEK